MKRVFLLFFKDLKLFFKSTAAVIMTFLVPMILILIFGMVFSGFGKESPLNSISLIVLDNDQSQLSKAFVTYLDSLKEIKVITRYKSDNKIYDYDFETLKQHIKKGKRKIGLVISKGFEKRTQNGDKPEIVIFYDPKFSIEYGIVVGLTEKVLMSKFPELMYNGMIKKSKEYLGTEKGNMFENDIQNVISEYFYKSESEDDNTDTSFSMDEPVNIKTEKLVGEDVKNPMFAQYVAGMAVMFLLFSLSRAGGSILQEKNSGTLNRLLIAPISSFHIIFSKMFFASFLGIFQLSVMFVFGWMVFGLEIFSHIFELTLMIIATALAASALGMFIASISKNEAQVGGLTTLIALGMSALGGSMFPTIIMPKYMQQIGKFTLNHWAMEGFTNIFWRNMTVKEIYPDILVLLGIFAILSLISIIIFEKKIFEK